MSETSPRIVARFALRATYRALGLQAAANPAVLLFGCFMPKMASLGQIFRLYSKKAILCLSPRWVSLGADAVLDILDADGRGLEFAVSLVDCAVALADELNARVGMPANDLATADRRRDKALQQEALREAGLASARQLVTADVEAAVAFSASLASSVVVKPRDSSGGDGIWLCDTESEIRAAYAAELGQRNAEDGQNTTLVVAEALLGEEWVVNTVSSDGQHFVTDAWRGPPKGLFRDSASSAGARFVYDRQYLEAPGEQDAVPVIEYTKRALDACGLRHGAAHTELVSVPGRGVFLYEINPRCAGGTPRTPADAGLNQLQALAWSLCDRPGWTAYVASTPQRSDRVQATEGLFSSPGAVVLHGTAEQVRRDADSLRELEATMAYSCEEELVEETPPSDWWSDSPPGREGPPPPGEDPPPGGDAPPPDEDNQSPGGER